MDIPLTSRCKRAFLLAHIISLDSGSPVVTEIHLLRGILSLEDSLASQVILKGVDSVKHMNAQLVESSRPHSAHFSKKADRVMELAQTYALSSKSPSLGAGHLVMGIYDCEGKGASILEYSGLNRDSYMAAVKGRLSLRCAS